MCREYAEIVAKFLMRDRKAKLRVLERRMEAEQRQRECIRRYLEEIRGRGHKREGERGSSRSRSCRHSRQGEAGMKSSSATYVRAGRSKQQSYEQRSTVA